MKLILIAQAALGFNLQEVFDYNFQNDPNNLQYHGCHCIRIAGNALTAAGSEPASATDSHCKDWQKARTCAKFSDACRNFDGDYDPSVSCENQANECAGLFCRLDTEFVNRITNSIASIDDSVSASCSYDKNVPKSHDGEACCLTDQFEGEFYKFAEKSCNNGQVSSEPSPIHPEDLNQVSAMLDSIPDLSFDHTDTWLGPEIDSGLQDLNGDLTDVTEISSDPQPTPLRRRRAALPQNFDLRDDAACGSMTKSVRNQGACGSCYAFAVASTTSQALCVASKGASQKLHSPMDVANCYEPILANKQDACKGGYTTRGFDHFRDNGIVTGTNVHNTLGSHTLGCYPYGMGGNSLAHFDFTQPMVPNCPRECHADYETRNFADDKQGGDSADIEVVRYNRDEQGVMEHIKEHGAVQASFTVYEDFFCYSGRVYTQNSNCRKGGHAVSIIGWGVENGVKYWLAKNSWGARWGENGFFKIRRGTNECGIENQMTGLRWKCAAGYSVSSSGKCVPGACSDTQYLENGVCKNCPMNGKSTADRTGCELRSSTSPARFIYFRSYSFDGTVKFNWINYQGKLDTEFTTSKAIRTYQKHPFLISVARSNGAGGRVGVFAGAPELIPGDDDVFYLINSDNQGSMISDSGAYPKTTRTGPSIDIKFNNLSGETLEVYWINWSGGLNLYKVINNNSDYIQQTYVDHRWAIKKQGGEWIWVGKICSENYLRFNGKTMITVWTDLKIRKSGY